MFAYGSKHTDLQRVNMSKKLLGSVVEWKLPVYEVSLSNDVYKVQQTKGEIRIGESGSDLMTAIIFITPRSDADRQVMEKLKTDELISFKGKVSEIILRSYVVIEPAIISQGRIQK